MPSEISSKSRRKLLTKAAAIVGGLGIATSAYPLVQSMSPSEKAKLAGANVYVDIGDIPPGKMKTVEWRRLPVWILHRTPEMLEQLSSFDYKLKDPESRQTSQQPEYARNPYRSIKPEFLVLVGNCTHLGCTPNLTPELGIEEIGDWWKGGFFCHCHNSEYDYAGRVFKGRSPAPLNLPVPPHKYISDTILRIGDQAEAV